MKTLNLSILSISSLALVSNAALAINNPEISVPATPAVAIGPGPIVDAAEDATSIKAFLEIANAWLDTMEADTVAQNAPLAIEENFEKTADEAARETIAYLGADTALISNWLNTAAANQADSGHNDEAWSAVMEARYTVLHHIVSVLEQLVVEQPQQALDIAQNSNDEYNRQWLSSTVITAWASMDASSAMNWLKEQENGQQDMHLHSVLYEMMVTDPASALLEIDALEDQEVKSHWHHTYATHLAESNPDAALQWAESLEAESRFRARQATFNSWYWTSREAALEASHTLLADDERAAFIQSIAYDLPDLDLGLAQSVFANGDEELRRSMAYSLVQSLYAQDPDTAEVWVEQLSQASVRTEAEFSLLQQYARRQPDKVLAALRQVDTERQPEVMDSVIWDLSYNNRNLVESWLIDGSLSQSEQAVVEDILQRIDNGEHPHGC